MGISFLLWVSLTFGQQVWYPKHVPLNVLPSSQFKTSTQCQDGSQTVFENIRFYTNDVYYPYDKYYNPDQSKFLTRFHYNESQITLYNNINNIMQNLHSNASLGSGFTINSDAAKGQWKRFTMFSSTSWFKAVNHVSNTLLPAAQLTYLVIREAFNVESNGNINIPSYTMLEYNAPSYTVWWPHNGIHRVWNSRTSWLECVNMYVSRCWDGYIDNSSTANQHTVPLASNTKANEQCEPGANLSSRTDDVMTGGSASATYNCSATCTVNPVPVPPQLALTKEVRNVSLWWSFYQADTSSVAVAASGSHQVQYKLTVTKIAWWPVTDIVKITDSLQTNGVTINSITVAWNPYSPLPSSSTFDIFIPANAFGSTNTVEVLINATVSSNALGDCLNDSMLYYGSSSLPIDALSDNAAYITVWPVGTPQLDIDKTYRDGNGNRVDQIPRAPGQSFEMKLAVSNIGTATAPDVFVKDQCDSQITCTSYTYYYNSAPTILYGPYSIINNLLQTTDIAPNAWLLVGQQIVILVQGSVNASTSGGVTIPNTAYVYDSSTMATPNDQDPAQIITPVLNRNFEITKTASWSLMSWSIVTYTFRIRNTDQWTISAYTLIDVLPSGQQYIPNTTKINWVSSTTYNPTSSNNILTRWCALNQYTQLNSTALCPLTPGADVLLSFDVQVQ